MTPNDKLLQHFQRFGISLFSSAFVGLGVLHLLDYFGYRVESFIAWLIPVLVLTIFIYWRVKDEPNS